MSEISQDYINDRSEVFLTNFLTSSRLSTDIPKHEKRPIWDGSLFLYKNSDRRKEGMERIPIQLKGTVSSFNGKYQIDKSDLLSYQSENGIIFFKVKMEVDENNEILKDQGKVYFIVLSRNIIDKLLEQIGDNESISITLKELNTKDIMQVCRKFLYLRKTYNNYETIEPSDFDNIEKISIPAFDDSESISELLLKDDEVVALAKIKGRSKEKIVNIAGFFSAETIENPISIHNKVFYDKYIVRKEKNLTKILLDENTIFTLSNLYEDSTSRKKIDLTFDYTQNNLLQAIKQTEFILAMCEHKSITFGTFNFNFDDFEFAEDCLQKLKTHMINRKAVLDKLFKFIKHFDLKNLNLKELTTNNYNFISDTFCDTIKLHNEQYKYQLYSVGNIKILVAFIKNENGLYSIKNAFDFLDNLEDFKTHSGKIFKAPILLHIPSNVLIDSANLNFDKINKTINNLQLENKNLRNFASRFLIELISCFDKTNNQKYLLSALKLCNLFKQFDFDMFIINETQIKKRLKLDIEENLSTISSLLNRPSKHSLIFQCCGHILLENKFKAKEVMKKLPEKDLNELKQWPIYKLFEE